jgi:hypothetical protein
LKIDRGDFQAGVFVALKQSRGEDTVIFRLKVKQIPVTYLCCAAILCMMEISKTGNPRSKYLQKHD